jgi:EAL domain-containing protein (putative c-di-GMP-specific phosphodiesterase class I)
LSINLAAQQIVESGMVSRVRAECERAGCEPEALCFEVTETAVLTDFDRASATLAGLRELGARVALDDFGTCYSSLEYLTRLPADYLKIPREFVRGATVGGDTPVMTTVCDLAHRLGLTVIAEGVETADELAAVVSAGIDAVQGRFLSAPMIASALGEQLAASASS